MLNVIVIIGFCLILVRFYFTLHRFFFIDEVDFAQRYGKDSYVCITGASSGMGKRFAIEFAKRGLNLLLIGSNRTKYTKEIINKLYPKIEVEIIEVDFCKAHKLNFFKPIKKAFEELDISILINNIGHRSGWRPYHEMPSEKINDTIICGTIVQCQLTKIAINKFLSRKRREKSGLIFVTAQNSASVGNNPIRMGSSDITIPFLSVYEAANTFGYVHAESIYKEYSDEFDILNITPGAVITENTGYLSDIPLSVDVKYFIKSTMQLIGNIQGESTGCWEHAIAPLLNFPILKDYILGRVGDKIANFCMMHPHPSIGQCLV
tara:strand:- start:1224 stop:2183 length:960 start_codon:yes stop_codon:yes gene_type:complete